MCWLAWYQGRGSPSEKEQNYQALNIISLHHLATIFLCSTIYRVISGECKKCNYWFGCLVFENVSELSDKTGGSSPSQMKAVSQRFLRTAVYALPTWGYVPLKESFPASGFTKYRFHRQYKHTAIPRWRHDMETLSTLLVLCKGNPPGYQRIALTGGFPLHEH